MSTTVKNWVTVKRGQRFRATNSRPEDWGYNGTCHYKHSHCDLCDTEITYRFGLTNRSTGQTLRVGSECIKWYYDAYMPNGLEMAVERMKLARRKEKQKLILEKIKKFADDGHRYIVDYLFGIHRRGFMDVYLTCDVKGEIKKVAVSKFRASMRRKGYLRPDEIEAFQSGYDRSRFGKAWDEHYRSQTEEVAA